MNFKYLIFSLLCALQFSPLYGGGSPYSRYGFGELTFFPGTRQYGMGNAGLALFGNNFINRMNPAGLAGITHTEFNGSFLYSYLSSQDNSASGTYSTGSFQGMSFAFPLMPTYGSTLMLEANPFSRVGYSIKFNQVVNSTTVTSNYFGDGGLYQFGVGTSFAAGKNYIFGAKLNYVFGTTRQTLDVTFDDASFTPIKYDRSIYHSGFNATLGYIANDVGEILGSSSLKGLNLALLLETPLSFNTTSENLYHTSTSSDTVESVNSSSTVPLAFGVGVAYRPSAEFSIVGDLYFQGWKNVTLAEQIPGEFRNSYRIGMGVEYAPRPEGPGGYGTFVYRAGFYYHTSYIQLNNTPINEMALTSGVDVPIGTDMKLNLGLQAGIRGTKDNNLQRDLFFRVLVSVSTGEQWFIELKEE
jgi:hypothetical protein